MDDTNNQQQITLNLVNYAMSAMRKAPYTLTKNPLLGTRLWMTAKQCKHFIKTQKIIICDSRPELLDTVYANVNQIGARRRAEVEFNHLWPDIRP